MLKLNKNRTFKTAVPIAYLDEEGIQHEGEISAAFKVLTKDMSADPELKDKALLDVVLVDVMDFELADDDGNPITGDAFLVACKGDPLIAPALIEAYWINIKKKPQTKT